MFAGGGAVVFVGVGVGAGVVFVGVGAGVVLVGVGAGVVLVGVGVDVGAGVVFVGVGVGVEAGPVVLVGVGFGVEFELEPEDEPQVLRGLLGVLVVVEPFELDGFLDLDAFGVELSEGEMLGSAITVS